MKTHSRQHQPLFYVTTLPLLVVAGAVFSLADWLFRTHHKPRTRILVIDSAKSMVPLVRNTTEPWCWNLPGGSYERGETGPQCAARELREETSLNLPPSTIRPLLRYTHHSKWRATWPLDCFIAEVDSTSYPVNASSFDVLEARWWEVSQVPPTSSNVALHCIALVKSRFI